MNKDVKLNEKIALDFMDIVSRFMGNNPKANFVKQKLQKEFKSKKGEGEK